MNRCRVCGKFIKADNIAFSRGVYSQFSLDRVEFVCRKCFDEYRFSEEYEDELGLKN